MEEVSKDSNYTLIVILMDDMDVLKQESLTPYMKTFLCNRTYLEANDPKIWVKLDDMLRQHKSTHGTRMPEDYQTSAL